MSTENTAASTDPEAPLAAQQSGSNPEEGQTLTGTEQQEAQEAAAAAGLSSTIAVPVKVEDVEMLRGSEMPQVDQTVDNTAADPVKASEPVAAAAPVSSPVVTELQPAVSPVTAAASGESLSVAAVRHDLAEYIKNMAPGKAISEKLGSFHQVRLFNVLLAVINRYSDDDFRTSMGIISELFRAEANGVFGEQYVFRFMEHVELSSPRIKLFQRLLNMFIVMAEPKSRKAALRQLNWQETLSGEITNDARNRVLNYFNVV
jgi:hypothetical protein